MLIRNIKSGEILRVDDLARVCNQTFERLPFDSGAYTFCLTYGSKGRLKNAIDTTKVGDGCPLCGHGKIVSRGVVASAKSSHHNLVRSKEHDYLLKCDTCGVHKAPGGSVRSERKVRGAGGCSETRSRFDGKRGLVSRFSHKLVPYRAYTHFGIGSATVRVFVWHDGNCYTLKDALKSGLVTKGYGEYVTSDNGFVSVISSIIKTSVKDVVVESRIDYVPGGVEYKRFRIS